MNRLLVVEGQRGLRDAVTTALQGRGFAATGIATLDDAYDAIEQGPIDALVLDLSLADDGGIAFLTWLKAQSSCTPIVIATGAGSSADRVTVLEAGADDYLSKPFSVRELVAQIRAVGWRRTPQRAMPEEGHGALRRGAWELDVKRREFKHRIRGMIALTDAEFSLVSVLLQDEGKTLSRQEIAHRGRNQEFSDGDRSIDVYVGRLRRKLGSGITIRTIRGVGYVIEVL